MELAKITHDMNVLTVADHFSLALIADAYADYMAASEAIKADGPTYRAVNREGKKMIKANPAVAMKTDAWRRVTVGLGKFGLTPAERANVSIVTPKKKNRFDDD